MSRSELADVPSADSAEPAGDRSLLRLVLCGSVDDGKSTLLGRLLYESKLILEDQLVALAADSARFGTQGAGLDLALLVDGLSAEREQGITIDVAYRFFSTDTRRFIVADAPGHEQYTRNMVTGASTADVAVLLVDARRGVLTQTRRHAFLACRLGIDKLVLAINKMDLVDYDERVYRTIVSDFKQFLTGVADAEVLAVPLSALAGDNVVATSARLPWYQGPSLLALLESIEPRPERAGEPLRLPVQLVLRPDHTFRGFAGSVVRGQLRPGDAVRIQPSGTTSTVARVLGPDGDLQLAYTGQAVTVTLTDEVDVSRGELIASAAEPASTADQFQADIVWMSEQPLMPGRQYRFKHGTRSSLVVLSRPKYKIDVNTLQHIAATSLQLNDIAVCEISLDREIAFDPYSQSRAMGSFLIIDRQTEDTLAAGMLRFALRRSSNIGWQHLEVDKAARAGLNGHRPCVIWLTGLSGAGKSTLANLIERRLHSLGVHSYLLDGDNLRHGLNHDLGFSEMDRVENVRRVGEVARLMADAGLVVLVSLISPYRDDRDRARQLVADGEFCEVFVDTPLAVAESRDPKGLYAKARAGELPNFTGIDSAYQPPLAPEVHVDTTVQAPEQSAELVIGWLHERGLLGPS